MNLHIKQYLKEHIATPPRVTDDSETLGSRLLTHDHAFGLYGTCFGYDAVVFCINGYNSVPRPAPGCMSMGDFLAVCRAASRPGRDADTMWSVHVQFPTDYICILSRAPFEPLLDQIQPNRLSAAKQTFNEHRVLAAYHDHLVGMAVRKARHETRALYMAPREFKP